MAKLLTLDSKDRVDLIKEFIEKTADASVAYDDFESIEQKDNHIYVTIKESCPYLHHRSLIGRVEREMKIPLFDLLCYSFNTHFYSF